VRLRRPLLTTVGLLCLACLGCLEAPEEEVPLEDLLGAPGTRIEDAPLLETAGLPNVDPSQFATSLAYLRGYADGEAVRYWNIDGANARFIAPLYQVQDERGEPVGRPIIDAVPGDSGYSPWWRVHIVRTTDAYAGEVPQSREAIDAAVKAGLLLEPQATSKIVNCPMVWLSQFTQSPGSPTIEATTVWYRGYQAHWLVFPGEFLVEPTRRTMPIFPVYLLQRIDEGAPLYEFATGVDIDGDAVLDNSNNIFASGLGGARYSPLWEAHIVRVSADYPSIDTSSTADLSALRSELDLFNADGSGKLPYVLTASSSLGLLVNCPILPTEAP